jgi:molybdopterin converting factor small subunit
MVDAYRARMSVRVTFHSYFRELAGLDETTADLKTGATLRDLLEQIFTRFPRLRPLQKSMLLAVGVDYQRPDFVLTDGDEVALFPPVQGG